MVMLKEKRFAWAYLRRSTDRQEQSIEDQKREVLRFAEEHDVELLRFFIDDAKSGTSTDGRKGFKEMIRLAQEKNRPVNTILVWNIARFGRYDPDEGGYYRFLLRQNGIEVVYISEGLQGNDSDDLLIPVKQWQAREYSKSLARDVIRGKITRMRKGGSNGQKAPYGYDRLIINSKGQPYMIVRTLTNGRKEVYDVRGKLIRTIPKGESIPKADKDWVSFVPGDPEKVEAVRKIFKWFICGHRGEEMGYKAIARALNGQGIPSPNGGYWGDSTIGSIIRNPFYYGRLTWNKTSKGRFYRICKEKGEEQPKIRLQRIRTNPKDDWLIKEDDHERIITKAEWMKAQARRGHDKRENKAGCRVNNIAVRGETNVSPYLLSGLIKCAACGHNFQGHGKKTGDRKYRYYVCGGYRSKGSQVCEEHLFSAETIERYVLEQIRGEFFEHVTRKQLLSKIEEELGIEFKDNTEELKQIDKALKENKKKVDQLLDNIDERHRDVLNEGLDKLKAERQFLEEEREKLLGEKKRKVNLREAAHEILEYLRNADQVLAKGTPQEKKVYVRQFITGITILPKKEEGIVGFYAFPQTDDSLLSVKSGLARTDNMRKKPRKSGLSAMPDFLSAEGGI